MQPYRRALKGPVNRLSRRSGRKHREIWPESRRAAVSVQGNRVVSDVFTYRAAELCIKHTFPTFDSTKVARSAMTPVRFRTLPRRSIPETPGPRRVLLYRIHPYQDARQHAYCITAIHSQDFVRPSLAFLPSAHHPARQVQLIMTEPSFPQKKRSLTSLNSLD